MIGHIFNIGSFDRNILAMILKGEVCKKLFSKINCAKILLTIECTYTVIVDILWVFFWYENKLKAPNFLSLPLV